MSPNIDIDEAVFDYLKSKAEPFVDTPNSVLRRALGIDSTARPAANIAATTHSSLATPLTKAPRTPKAKAAKLAAPKRTRAASGTLLPEDQYEMPLLHALVDAGGQAPYRDVVDAVGRDLENKLMPADFENLTSGGVRWQSRLQFVRLRLIERGYLDREAPRGIWGITDEGRAFLAKGEVS